MELTNILLAYIALHLAVLWHEIGHFGSRIRFPYFPLPIMYAENSRFTYGGLLFNSIAFITVWYFKPQLLFALKYLSVMNFSFLL